MDLQSIANLGYLIAAVFFILGLKRMSHPKTAVQGNLFGALGMFIAVVITLVTQGILNIEYILIGIAAGTLVGTLLALKIKMTAMPQLVGLFNGFGGIASVLVAGAALYLELAAHGAAVAADYQFTVSIAASGIIGAVTFFGSIVAFGKLQGLVTEKPVRYPGEQVVKVLLAGGAIAVGVLIVLDPTVVLYYWIMAAIAGLLGLMLVLPIGGADMPIVIALLNSYSGIAAAATGFVLNNSILIVAGSLVGASGIILTRIMCKAMNRSLANVLFGGVGAVVETKGGDDIYAGKVTSTSAEEVAMILKSAQRVVFVPGYGMAVARAQAAVRMITEMMEKDGIEVAFGIHPVAGRMPGHMNVLLAEENISYDKLLEMDQVNPTFPNTDVVIVLGANDVVNPVARESSGNPIAGMPILDVDKARTVVVIKRSLSPGFAGIANPLFAADNSLMLFGDGKQVVEELVTAYKEV
ncbi:NAD(P)(+) transhydrogenase (Re/Si-specific) subunit beta [Spirochaeta africana]|uniref:NAD(P) transhydrogenase subunit beta n=1 Tax=Spirochaeta africana (strain ATCC 700263 / DSM 8902 / Z-7692) TaxID=889378 RepID=H9UMR8_SPIAZ|nr:NAD(P)(+) transhydrogenase (Re/Si-specific) subunit beta [Spirochaeta africana]AFG38811.1 NAD/NADP transhydrogenase beta subunit [Spirochaeta africana DSM 8902]